MLDAYLPGRHAAVPARRLTNRIPLPTADSVSLPCSESSNSHARHSPGRLSCPPLSRRHLVTMAAGIARRRRRAARCIRPGAAPRPRCRDPPAGPFELPPLTYPTNALEPHIDAKTMEIHHDRHHQAFITNLNNLAKTNPQLGTSKPIETCSAICNALNDDIKFARPQQSRRPRQPHHVLADHGSERRQARRRGAGRDRQRSRRPGEIPDRFQCRRRPSVRLGLGVRDRRQGRQARDRDPSEPGQSDHGRQARA